ncbi:hypothetical protein Sjap_011287 [Stephania japonica]|uniref:Uncharacterized protein n=1 Tax=Stephania japonica TaxID=461633 RepID=A0AAP0JD40_9MAGN
MKSYQNDSSPRVQTLQRLRDTSTRGIGIGHVCLLTKTDDLSKPLRSLELLRLFSRSFRSLGFHCSLSSSSSLSSNLCYLISKPTFLSFAPQCLLSKSSWLRRDWRRFDFRICALSSFAIVAKPGGIKVKVFKEENYLANWIKVDNVVKAMSILALFNLLGESSLSIAVDMVFRVIVTIHIGEMTVRETLAFSARVQGVGATHAELLLELSRRKKEANIKPDTDLDLFMKSAALDGQEASVITDYIIKVQVIKMLGKSMKILEVDKRSLMLSSSLTIVVAINGSRKSNCALKWALERFSDEGKFMFKLLHVRARITTVPTPMGNYIPILQVRDDVAIAYKKEMEWKTSKRLLPHKQLCSEKKVHILPKQMEATNMKVLILSAASIVTLLMTRAHKQTEDQLLYTHILPVRLSMFSQCKRIQMSKKGKLHQSKNIDTALEGTRVLAKPSLPEAMNKCFLLIASYLVQTRFGAWGCFAFGEDSKDIITTNLEKLLVSNLVQL